MADLCAENRGIRTSHVVSFYWGERRGARAGLVTHLSVKVYLDQETASERRDLRVKLPVCHLLLPI